MLTFILFGATGDLAQKKIIPALLHLFASGTLTDSASIIAFSRRSWTDMEYREFIKPSLDKVTDVSQEHKQAFLNAITYVKGTFDTDEGYELLKQKVTAEHVLFHLAVQPEFYEIIFKKLGEFGFAKKEKLKLLIEKPFGQDYSSAQHLEKTVEQYFSEEQIYRIDHYLAKYGLVEILKQRQADQNFESRLSGKDVQSLHVTLLETSDIIGRGEFYDTVGALRDVGQNHVLQMLAVTTMELPQDVHEIGHERAKILQQLALTEAEENIIRAQYEEYTQDEEVAQGSQTETYFKIKAEITNDRWKQVPIVLEGGKAVAKKVAEVKITFKDGTEKVFHMEAGNRDAYQILIEKAVQEDKAFFVSIDEVLASWEFIDTVREQFKKVELMFYKKGNTP